MQKVYTPQSAPHLTDSQKGQKIVAALYLVTDHLSDTDPMKAKIRTLALGLIDRSAGVSAGGAVVTLLGAAVLAGIISAQNVAILTREISGYASRDEGVLGTLFDAHTPNTASVSLNNSTRSLSDMSHIKDHLSVKAKKQDAIYETKNKRQNDILACINERKSVGIKDIALLFTDVSEKTIQRELGLLVEQGKITKRGSKRWSIYMAI